MRILALGLLLAGCGSAMKPESDAHATLDPDRDVVVRVGDSQVRVTDLPGAEDAEAVSPDGRWVAFVGTATGIGSVWVAEVPAPGEPPRPAVQLTNVGLERVKRRPGQAPPGFVPTPDLGPLRWADDRTIEWTSEGSRYTAQVPR